MKFHSSYTGHGENLLHDKLVFFLKLVNVTANFIDNAFKFYECAISIVLCLILVTTGCIPYIHFSGITHFCNKFKENTQFK